MCEINLEWSIAEVYILNECLTFYSSYLEGAKTCFSREEQNIEIDRKLSIFSQNARPFEVAKYDKLARYELNMARWYIFAIAKLNNFRSKSI